MLPKVKAVPDMPARDTWLLDLYLDMRSPMASGAQLDLLRWKCEAEGLVSHAAQLEVWERVRIVESAMSNFRELRAESLRRIGLG